MPPDDEPPQPEDFPDFGEPPVEPPADRPELRLRDLAQDPGCSVCGRRRDPYIRLEVRGRIEYTCRECATGSPPSRLCASCGEPLAAGDAFCGRCGTAAATRCPKCGTPNEPGDRFCGKCGASL